MIAPFEDGWAEIAKCSVKVRDQRKTFPPSGKLDPVMIGMLPRCLLWSQRANRVPKTPPRLRNEKVCKINKE